MQEADVCWNLQLAGCVPAGLVERENGVGAGCNAAADLVQMMLHGDGIGTRKNEGSTGIACWTYRSEQVCVGVPLILGLARARSLRSPLIDQAVLLTDPHFILEPDLDPGGRRYVLSGDCLRHPCGKVF